MYLYHPPFLAGMLCAQVPALRLREMQPPAPPVPEPRQQLWLASLTASQGGLLPAPKLLF